MEAKAGYTGLSSRIITMRRMGLCAEAEVVPPGLGAGGGRAMGTSTNVRTCLFFYHTL